MKKITILLIVLLAGSQLKAQTIFEKWEELNNYHEIMSQTFHPAENDDLEPLKTKAKELSEKANALAESKIPMEFDSKEIRDAVAQLKTDSKALYAMIEDKSSSDDEIKSSITALHDVYHQIVGLCKGEDHEE